MNKKVASSPNSKREKISWIVSIIVAVVAALFIRTCLFEIVMVDGASMEPTLQTGERVGIEKVTRYFQDFEYGQVVVVHYPSMEGNYVKRIMGLPGDKVQVTDSTVYRNNIPLEEDYINPLPYPDTEEFTVPEGHIFVMGDNRSNSLDSRMVGPIPFEDIVGHGIGIFWPLDKLGGIAD